MKLSLNKINDSDLYGGKVIMRVDFNVPLDDEGNITDDTRIKASIPSIKYLVDKGARLVLMSHLGRPKGSRDVKYSLLPVSKRLSELISLEVKFSNDCIGQETEELVEGLKNGDILLLENVRFYNQETDNEDEFSKSLAQYGDIYVNDAFGTTHRAHSSTQGITKYIDKCAMGFLIEKELDYLVNKLESPARPFVVIMGGAKVSDKIDVLKGLMDKADVFIIGGAMANTFRLAQGYEIGASLAEADKKDVALEILNIADEKGVKFLLPCDTRYTLEFRDNAPTKVTGIWGEDGVSIPKEEEGIDIGDKAIEEFVLEISKAKTIIWNGPMGVFEKKGFDIGTKAVGKAISDNKDAIKIVGGGDSVTAANLFGFGECMDHMSTGGGASLELLEGKNLPGISALNNL